MANCQKCDMKKPWGVRWAKGREVQELSGKMGIEDRKLIGILETDKDVCPDCTQKIWMKHSLEYEKFFNESLTPQEKEASEKDEGVQKILLTAKKQKEMGAKLGNSNESKSKVSIPPSDSMSSNKGSSAVPSRNSPPPTTPSAGYTTAEQLKQIADGQHDSFKKQWNKGALVEFKSERVVILHRMTGAIVQFLVAYDQVTKEGYRLMAIDEGKTVDGGAGFSGGLNAYFYFQKMDNVR